jgi:hypothetical protein
MPTHNQAVSVLLQFPGPVILYPSRKKWLLIFGTCALFAVGGIAMVRSSEPMGWYVLIVFALAAVVAAVVMLPQAGRLRLDREGFEVTSLFRRHRSRWLDASGFTVSRIPPASYRLVVYDDVTQSAKSMAKFNVGLTGRNAALPDTYGLPPAELAELMAGWRERALAQAT